MKAGVRKFIFAIIAITSSCTLAAIAQDRPAGRSFVSRSEVLGTNGMVASSHPLVSQVALSILQKGGNAIDAAIAGNALQGFLDPAMNGIGGDLFAIVWDAKTKKLFGLNGSGRSPKALTLEYLTSKGLTRIPANGPLSVSVPGCVDGWFQLHGRFGKTKFDELLAPAIHYAANGFPIGVEGEFVLNFMKPNTLPASPFKDLYYPEGKILKMGDVFKNPDLANTLSLIAKKGRDGFYKGELPKRIEAYMRSVGGFLSAEDFAAHQSEWVEPVSTNYRGYDVWELPPNGQGIAALEILNILEGFNLKEAGYASKEHIHYLVEAKRLAFEDMAKYYGDPSFNKVPVDQLISKAYASERRKLIKENEVGNYEPGPINESNTIYLTVADKEGNMISLIQSNASLFGSTVVVPGTGFSFQNRGAFFELQKGHINEYAPGKRPFHTIIPSFVTKDGKPFMSFGVMGGDMQVQGHVQILINMIDFGMSLQEAGDAPRVKHLGTFPYRGKVTPGEIQLESGFPYETIRALMMIGHKVGYTYDAYGGYQAIMLRNGVYYGASDSRKDGAALGY
jgi:gamma-glutamyltranspeptidase / glutathione hydrolase